MRHSLHQSCKESATKLWLCKSSEAFLFFLLTVIRPKSGNINTYTWGCNEENGAYQWKVWSCSKCIPKSMEVVVFRKPLRIETWCSCKGLASLPNLRPFKAMLCIFDLKCWCSWQLQFGVTLKETFDILCQRGHIWTNSSLTMTSILASVYCVLEVMYIIAPWLIRFTFAMGYPQVWMGHVGNVTASLLFLLMSNKKKGKPSVLLVPVFQNIDFINISWYHEWFVVLRCWGDSNFSREAQTILSFATSSILLDETAEMRGLNPQLCLGFSLGSPHGRTCPKTSSQADTQEANWEEDLNHLQLWRKLHSCSDLSG